MRKELPIRYDPEADILVVKIKDGKGSDTMEISDDIFAILNKNNEIIEIEIWRAKKNIGSLLCKNSKKE